MLATAESDSALLEKVLKEPGRWSQMCAGAGTLDFDVPLPLYTLAAPRMNSLSAENLGRLKQRQPAIVRTLSERLKNIDLTKPAKSGREPQLSGVLLDIVISLRAIETLPELLRLEHELNWTLIRAESQGAKVLPSLDLDSPLFWKGEVFEDKTHPDQRALFTVRVYQRELLSVMAALLRQQKMPELLHSEIEAKYAEHVKTEAQTPELRDINKPADVPQEQRGWISFDPIYGLPVREGFRSATFIPYSTSIRNSIRQCATDYLKEHPAPAKLSASSNK
jgi:hypothetical protein